jgi:3-mercaptopyruvate sulfurtransferase SseA
MKKNLLKVSILLLLAISACNALLPQSEPTVVPTIQAIATLPQTQPQQGQTNLPLTEADVPRVPVAEAKLAFDNGKAVIVDVRSAEAYATGHIQGAISIPLAKIETNIKNVPLDKNQWIITYCT